MLLLPIIHLSMDRAVTSRVKVISMVHPTFRQLLTIGRSCHPAQMQIHFLMVVHSVHSLWVTYLLYLNILQVKQTTMHLIHPPPPPPPLLCILQVVSISPTHHWTLGIKILPLMLSSHMPHKLLSIHTIHLTPFTMVITARMILIFYVITTHEVTMIKVILKVTLPLLHQSLISGHRLSYMVSCYHLEFLPLIIFMKIMDEILTQLSSLFHSVYSSLLC